MKKEVKDWNFDMFEIESKTIDKWDLYEILKKLTNKESKILDLGTGGGEKVLKYFPDCAEILGTDYSTAMLETAKKNLELSGRKNITFRFMDNLAMDVPDKYFDVVVARHTVIEPVQIYKCLKPGGYLLVRGVDQHDCWGLKMIFGKGQGYTDQKPISISDYESIVKAGYKDVELVPIHEREYYKNPIIFKEFLKKVPIIQDCSEETNISKHHYDDDINQELLDEYIKENTFNGKIRLLRRYYGISAKK